ncbi:hypothetical protein [Helicobacter bilis]|uniref:Uncharacterized protein n=2 Tax=Helicobacter bilis TaxID=37372 RepID=A0A6D2CAI0_9HELI|nr:hypothetical protein [Helicobacter bilis]EMZ37223.1 hypothetical protein C826_02220 [Helicobacter bilis WiWa]TLE03987.1 hypothetical protein LS77_007475 [Helicobacter bilis]TLE04712.1 hypothetical protein LS76_007515 [Helicobacter bilis]
MFKSVNLNQKTENANDDKLQEFINNASGSEPTRKIGGVKKGMILKDEKDKRVKRITLYLTQEEHDYLKSIAKSYRMTIAEYSRTKLLTDDKPIEII